MRTAAECWQDARCRRAGEMQVTAVARVSSSLVTVVRTTQDLLAAQGRCRCASRMGTEGKEIRRGGRKRKIEGKEIRRGGRKRKKVEE